MLTERRIYDAPVVRVSSSTISNNAVRMCSFHNFLSFFSLTACCLHSTYAQGKETTQLHLSGSITEDQIFSFVYVPFDVSQDVTSLYVLQNYSLKGAGNALDLGIFDPKGVDAINTETGFSGSRGWSGGFRNNFTISASDATPGHVIPGTWNVVLGPYATNRSGIDWTLDITLSTTPNSTIWSPSLAPMSPSPMPTSKWLRGDFHAHSVYSDGRYLPSEQIANAVSQQLDFMFFSEHNTDSGNNDIGRWIPDDGSADDLLIGRAIEVTTRFGHWQAIGLERQTQVEWRYTNASGDTGFVDTANQVKRSGGMVSVNHPYANCSRCDFTFGWDFDVIDSIEIWNGKWDVQDENALKFWQEQLIAGERIPIIGGSDAHSFPDMIGLPTTIVLAEGRKGQAEIVEAVRAGHAYMVEGPGMEIEFRVGKNVEMGDVVRLDDHEWKGASPMAVFAGTGFAGARACWVTEEGYVKNDTIPDDGSVSMAVEGLEFVRVEVRNQTDIVLGLTNPIYVE